MLQLTFDEILPGVHELLSRKYGPLEVVPGQGVTRGQRVAFEENGQRVRCVIKTSAGGRISFGKRDDGTWSGLSECERIVVVGPNTLNGDEAVVSMFDQRTLLNAFNANYEATKTAALTDKDGRPLPSWISPFHEEARGPRGVGDGFGDKAIWAEPLNLVSDPIISSEPPAVDTTRGLTIQEAKQGLAKTFGVSADAVEITIRG